MTKFKLSQLSRLAGIGVSSMVVGLMALVTPAHADPQTIRNTLRQLVPTMPPIDEITPSQIAGLWQVRIGGTIVYTDASGSLLLEGALTDMRTRTNLTQQAINKALAVPFETLPLKDAVLTHQEGKGERLMAVFADPNCGFCKRFEADLVKLTNVKVYTFMLPFLGQKSEDDVRSILCSSDPARSWKEWMLSNMAPTPTPGGCAAAAALTRNRDLAQRLGVTGTPTSLFTNQQRLSGALPIDQVLAQLEAK
jgi:thiol:disulfide interchange protein DsbC